MQDVTEQEFRDSYRATPIHPFDNANSRGSNRDNNGFVVQGGPWEQQRMAPNTASVTEFPSFGGRNMEEPPHASPVTGAWGPRR